MSPRPESGTGLEISAPPTALRVLILLEVLCLVGYETLWGEQVDLSVYRMAGGAALSGYDNLYELRDVPSALPFTYPPFAALLFMPLSTLGFLGSKLVVLTASLAALLRVAWLLAGAVGPDSPFVRWSRETRAGTFLAVALVAEPFVSNLNFGQINILLMWAVVEDAIGVRHRYNGALIGLAASVKLTPLIFLAYLIFFGKRRAAAVGTLAFLGALGIALVCLPRSSAAFWTGAAFDVPRVGGIAYVGNQSINGALWRIFGAGGDPFLWMLVSCLTLTCGVVVLRAARRHQHDLEGLSAAATIGLLISPVSWTHHWVYCLIIAVALLDRAARSAWRAAVAWSFVSIMLSWVVWWLPHGGDLEYQASWFQKLIGDAYVVLGIAVLITMLATRTRAED